MAMLRYVTITQLTTDLLALITTVYIPTASECASFGAAPYCN